MTESMRPRPRRTLFRGTSTNLCGWCHYHDCGLTVRQMRVKKCLKKQCHWFQRFPEHGIWQQREAAKRAKKQRKLERGY
ncbi:MAG: hypothetical protein J5706_04715 [Elusimicrobiales bacterium]|nr:hypothetical protein [Elusimicrobiales bacterium]